MTDRPPSLNGVAPVPPTGSVETRRVFLLPGEMAFVREPTRLATLLGSCVAVCLFDPVRSWGGMNHYMVAESGGTRLEAGKCGDRAIPQLIHLATLAGCEPAKLKARIYGGGAVVGALASTGGDVGQRNIDRAYHELAAAGITVSGDDTGGDRGRKIEFDTGTGQIRSVMIEQSEGMRRRRELLGRQIKVLIIDDSQTVRRVLAAAIAGDERLVVIGEAEDPFQARELILAEEPDVLCLDVIMPRLDGLSFLRKLMQFKPIPTVVVSTVAKHGSEMERKLFEAGARAVIDKEQLAINQGLDKARAVLLPALHRAAATLLSSPSLKG
jgi:chemotaxis protein CheD